jgi:hypothetical protein
MSNATRNGEQRTNNFYRMHNDPSLNQESASLTALSAAGARVGQTYFLELVQCYHATVGIGGRNDESGASVWLKEASPARVGYGHFPRTRWC